MTAAEQWIAKRREIAVSDALWHHVGNGVIVEEIPGGDCTCSPHYGAHEPHCGIEHVLTAPSEQLAEVLVDARTSLPRANDALEKVRELAADQDAVYDSDLIAAIESALGIEAGGSDG